MFDGRSQPHLNEGVGIGSATVRIEIQITRVEKGTSKPRPARS